ncbi:hypothetical protein JCM10213_004030 [Rhodosporidiobolus nylandii]
MASKWATAPYEPPADRTPSSTASPALQPHPAASLLSLLNDSRSSVATPGSGTSTAATPPPQQASTTPPSRDEFVYEGKDAAEDASGRGEAGTWARDMEGSSGAPSEADVYSKHAPPGYRYSSSPSTSPLSSSSASPRMHYPPLFSDDLCPSAVEKGKDAEARPSLGAGVDARTRAHERLAARARLGGTIPLGAKAAADAMAHDKGPLPLHTTPHPYPANGGNAQLPFAADLEQQLEAAKERSSRLAEERNDLARRLDEALHAVKVEASVGRVRQEQAEKVRTELEGIVHQLEAAIRQRGEELAASQERAGEAESRLAEALADIVRHEDEDEAIAATRQSCAALEVEVAQLKQEKLAEERRTSGLKKDKEGLEEAKKAWAEKEGTMEEEIKVLTAERDAVKLALADKSAEATDVRAALSASEARNFREQAIQAQQLEDASAAAESLAALQQQKKEAIVQRDVLEFRFISLEREHDAVVTAKAAVEASLVDAKKLFAQKIKVLRTAFEAAEREKAEQAETLSRRIVQLETGLALSSSPSLSNLSSAAPPHPRLISPSALLELSESPQVGKASALFASVVPPEISSNKPEALYSDSNAPGRRLATVQVAHALCKNRYDRLLRKLEAVQHEKAHLASDLSDLQQAKEQVEQELDDSYKLMHDVLEETRTASGVTQVLPDSATSNFDELASTSTSSSTTAAQGFGSRTPTSPSLERDGLTIEER